MYAAIKFHSIKEIACNSLHQYSKSINIGAFTLHRWHHSISQFLIAVAIHSVLLWKTRSLLYLKQPLHVTARILEIYFISINLFLITFCIDEAHDSREYKTRVIGKSRSEEAGSRLNRRRLAFKYRTIKGSPRQARAHQSLKRRWYSWPELKARGKRVRYSMDPPWSLASLDLVLHWLLHTVAFGLTGQLILGVRRLRTYVTIRLDICLSCLARFVVDVLL